MRGPSSFVADALKHHYGIAGNIRALPGELDLNFEVDADGERYVFKVMRADCAADFVDLQIKAMEHAERNGLAGYIPKVIRTQNNNSWLTLKDDKGDMRIAWLISFLPGRLMADIAPWTPPLAASIGEIMGRMCKALEDFDHPLATRDLKWDLRQGGWIADHLNAFSDPEKRRMVEGIAQRFADDLSLRLNALPKTPIHGDANDMNILVHEHGPNQGDVAGIFDFGDMVKTPRVCEPAIAMAYAMMGAGDGLARGAALVAGFHKVSPLSDNEIRLLLPLTKLRLAISVTNAAVERVAHPDNAYLSVSEAPAWDLLDKLDWVNEETATQLFADACGTTTSQSETRNKGRVSLAARRAAVAPGNQRLSYKAPLHPVRGSRHFLYDADGDEYLDAYNNVPHVGHANPVVVDAVRRQMSLLNTNTRYLQDIHAAYAERMIARLPDPLSNIVFLSSASEANEFALRLARAVTGARDMMVMNHGYHGGTTGAMDISPYKFHHPKGAGAAPDWVHVTSQPDIYRGDHRGDDAAARYIDDVKSVLADLDARKRPLAGFISECLPSVGGQIVLPQGYLATVYDLVRQAGGVCIADDVQTALGRLGDFFWGFEQQKATPDIAVFGKPLGNGFPLAAVAMTDRVSKAFAQGPEFFSTFGGSSAACAAGNAVLDVLDNEDLPKNAAVVGDKLLAALRDMAKRYEIIGEIRGSGLFIGVDLVLDHKERAPATIQADYIKNRLREEKALIGVEGPADNVLKIRPPMTFDDAAADQLLAAMDKVLREDGARP